jgi:hypothetical protein
VACGGCSKAWYTRLRVLVLAAVLFLELAFEHFLRLKDMSEVCNALAFRSFATIVAYDVKHFGC